MEKLTFKNKLKAIKNFLDVATKDVADPDGGLEGLVKKTLKKSRKVKLNTPRRPRTVKANGKQGTTGLWCT